MDAIFTNKNCTDVLQPSSCWFCNYLVEAVKSCRYCSYELHFGCTLVANICSVEASWRKFFFGHTFLWPHSYCIKFLFHVIDLIFRNDTRGHPYMMSDGMGEGGSAKSDFISKGSLIKHLMRGGQKRLKIIWSHIWTIT